MDFQKVKAVIFDLDGTLLDTVGDIGAGANTALRRYGLPEHPIAKYRDMVGHGIRTLFRAAVPEGTDEETLENALQFYLHYYPENCTVHTDYFPGIASLIQTLDRAGYRMAVISNKTEMTTLRVMAHYFPGQAFAFVWGNNATRPLKPAIDAGKLACRELGLTPEEILYFGDGDTDMEFGSKMGFLTVGCTWGYRSPAQLREAGAQLLVDSVQELLTAMGLQ